MRINSIHIVLLFSIAAAAPASQVIVSPNGTDSNPGSATRPAASLTRAIELSRELPLNKPKRILLRAGEYFDTGVTLTPKDSNLVIESESAAKPAGLVGGVPLSGWRRDDGNFWSAPLPGGRLWDVRLLQVNGRFCSRARFPPQGTLNHQTTFNVPWMSTTGGGWKRKPTLAELTTLKYKEGDIPSDLDLTNAEITVFHMWDESVAAITNHDPASRTLILDPPLGHPPGAFGVQKYCLWNIKQGMTHAGQWYFDRTRHRIVYWPLPGEQMSQARVVVPTQRSIIKLAGATNVTLRNLSLSVTTVPLITGGFAAGAFDGAVQIASSSAVSLLNLQIANVAGQAIKALHHQDRIRVENCDIQACGAGGIYLSGSNNVVENNFIHDVGRMFPSAMAINGGGRDFRVAHNEIDGTPYSAIGLGGENLVIEGNRISHCMEVLHDGAAIYCFGMKHSVLRGNYAYDIVDTGGYGASAYYLDEQCQNCVVEKNISFNVARPSHNHMATNNIIRQNVFVTTGDMHITFPRCTGYELQSNVLYAAGKIVFEGIGNVRSWSKNLVYSGAGKIEGTLLNDYTTAGTVPGVCGDTLNADPLFVDVAKGDLRYRSGSLARKLGLPVLRPVPSRHYRPKEQATR